MKFIQSSKSTGAILVTAVVLLAGLAGCTTDGGSGQASPKPVPSPSTESSAPMSSDTSQYITVTGDAGKPPVLGSPKGAAPSHLVVSDIYPGTGATVAAGSTLTVQYTLLAWSTGKIVESSWTGGSPATFPLAGVIQGWQQGLPGMKAGGRRLLIIPPALGYGSVASGPIAANETLVFVVDVLKVA